MTIDGFTSRMHPPCKAFLEKLLRMSGSTVPLCAMLHIEHESSQLLPHCDIVDRLDWNSILVFIKVQTLSS